ncbi:MAG: formate dehydrogenase, partial [Verrucomicrobia bacterium]|nr:formate dehydrogenase [Verrucomicrobiota bacterium]
TLSKTGDAIQWGGARLCDDGRFATADGRAHFKVVPVPPRKRDPGGPEGQSGSGQEFVVSTRRGKQFNTLIYDAVDPLTGAPREAVFMNPEDAAALQVQSGDPISLVNATGRYDGVVFPAPIARGNLQVHWPEGNGIIPRGRVDAVGGVPDYNAVVRVERCRPPAQEGA